MENSLVFSTSKRLTTRKPPSKNTCFEPGREVNNKGDNIFSGRPGLALGLLKNRSYFLQNDKFMEKMIDKLHYLDPEISRNQQT